MFKYPTNSEVVATVYTPKTEVNASSTQHDPSPRPVGVFAATGRHGHLDRLTGQVGVWVQARRCAEQSTGVQVDHYRQIQFRATTTTAGGDLGHVAHPARVRTVCGGLASLCRASSSWQEIFSFEVGDGRVGQAGVDVCGPVPGDRFVGSGVVIVVAVGVDLLDQTQAVVGHDRHDWEQLASALIDLTQVGQRMAK